MPPRTFPSRSHGRHKPDLPLSAEAQLSIERQRIALLGAAATPAEQLQLKIKELAAATDGWTRNQNEGNRALDAFIRGQARAAVASRTRLGIVTEEELITRGLNDLRNCAAMASSGAQKRWRWPSA